MVPLGIRDSGERKSDHPPDIPLTLRQLEKQKAAIFETIRQILKRFGPGLTQLGIRQSQDQLLKASTIMADVVMAAARQMRNEATTRQLLVRAIRNIDPEAARIAFTPALNKYNATLLESNAFRAGTRIAFDGGTILAQGDIAGTLGLFPTYDPLAPYINDFLADHTGRLVREVTLETQRAITGQIERAFNVGGAPRDVARPIREILTANQSASHMLNTAGLTRRQSLATDRYLQNLLDNGMVRGRAVKQAQRYAQRQLRYRAMNISRTEILRTANAGQQELFEQAIRQGVLDPVIQRKVWISSADDRVCRICKPMNGKTVGIVANFSVSIPKGGGVGSVVSQKHPPAHPQCLPGDALVLPRGEITGATKRWFDGEVVVVERANSLPFTSTPNHPVFTRRGWVHAGDLEIGDEIAEPGFGQGVTSGDGQDVDRPARIEDVVESFLRSSDVTTVPVPVAAPDFHGDGVGSEVAVVGAYGGLWRGGDAVEQEVLADVVLSRGGPDRSSLSGGGDSLLCHHGLRLALAGAMGGTDLSATSGLTHSGPLGSLGLATGSSLDTGFGEPSHDDRSADLVSGGDTAGGLSTEVSAADLVYRKVDAFHRESFCGYVYNLETATGYYVAQGVVASNCRCTIAIQQVDPALFPDLGLV